MNNFDLYKTRSFTMNKKHGLLFGASLLTVLTAVGAIALSGKASSLTRYKEANAEGREINQRDFGVRNEYEKQDVTFAADRLELREGKGKYTIGGDAKSVSLTITTPEAADWMQGLCINTDKYLDKDGEYEVTLTTARTETNPFNVELRYGNPYDGNKVVGTYDGSGSGSDGFYGCAGGELKVNFKATENGNLWLYIASGNYANTITVSALKVGPRFVYEKTHDSYGVNLHTTLGGWDAWGFGLSNWEFPTTAGKAYYCEFVLKIDSYGWEASEDSKFDYSEVVLKVNEGSGEGVYAEAFNGKFVKDTEFYFGTNFTGREGGNSSILLQLGAIRSAIGGREFTVSIKEFVLKEDDNVGKILERVSFASGADFATKWNTEHTLELCDPENIVKTKGLIDEYCLLTPEQRAIVDNTDDSLYPEIKISVAIRNVATAIGYPIND